MIMNLSQDKLSNILNELSFYKRDKKELYINYINERLNKSLLSYYDSLNSCTKSIYNRYDKPHIFKESIK